ncbi:MAG: FG-GAP-like repeat-containing protein, partial [Bacteroidota bacterium]
DMDLDLFIVAHAQDDNSDQTTLSKLYRNNNNGTFTDVTAEVGLINLFPPNEDLELFLGLVGFKYGASWGDYDNNGFPDLLLTNAESVQLFSNQDGIFTDVTEASGIVTGSLCRNTGATWFDYNNDGFLDLYINDWDFCETNSLFLNNGDGTFQNVTANSGVQDNGDFASYVGFPFDINEDGLMDIYISNDFEDSNNFFINQNGSSFIDQAAEFGLDNRIDDMGIALGDFNLDGAFDFFITGIDEVALLQNDGSNSFTETSMVNGIAPAGWAWGTRFADFDLDGDEDLIIVNGYDFQNRDVENNVFYKNLTVEGGSGFEDISGEFSINALTTSVEVLDFDYDNDGDLDIYVTNSEQSSFLYENKLLNFNEENSQHFFKVHLEGTISNRDAIGTTLTLTTNQGILKRYYCGVGFLSQSLQAVHFGLGTDIEIQSLEIKWPSGLIENHTNLDIDSTIKAIEGQGFEVLDILPSQKVFGCLDPTSCTYNPEATIDDGSCTYLNSNVLTGPQESGFLKTETYGYSIAEGSTSVWTVTGGEIIEGQSTNEIVVEWGLTETGTVSVQETDGECFSEITEIAVALSASERPEDISIARLWNEILLESIRNDFARPTVHARNLFHTSVAMYDIWAVYNDDARLYLIGNTLNGFSSELENFIPTENKEISMDKAISYAMFRLLKYRFQNSPNPEETNGLLDLTMQQLGHDADFDSNLYQFGNAAAFGNFVAETIINYGNIDGSREQTLYDNAYYEPINEPLSPNVEGFTIMNDPNRWQPLNLDSFIDQSGNLIEGDMIDFLSPEWGNVFPFAMNQDDAIDYQRDGDNYKVYNDPREPPLVNLIQEDEPSENFKWGFSLVSIWGAHLDPNDGVIWDISPNQIGNIDFENLPTNFNDYPSFYDYFEGGDTSQGHSINPITNLPYETQLVPRGDYTRVLAEFWADGPDSETPPGHWFTILNYVNDHPEFEKRLKGIGEVLDPLEWDVKAYFTLGGAMHDAAISAWSVKGWYDYVRPISAIRNMAALGQSSNPSLDNYHVGGIPLVEGFIELVDESDELYQQDPQNLGKIKLYSWRGPDFLTTETGFQAGVGWILAEDWWPYQRPTFVTPPFAGYVSGHSTFSRAAAEVLTELTGSEYFPGGLGEFTAKQNEFLVFEKGPSVDVILQWATYRDASEQTSLSRIWGGIHPPADDIPGRIMGEKVGKEAFSYALSYFSDEEEPSFQTERRIYPNPVINHEIFVTATNVLDTFSLFDIQGRNVGIQEKQFDEDSLTTRLSFPQDISFGLYFLNISGDSKMIVFKN